MSKVYYKIGELFGNPILIEIDDNDRNRDANLSECWEAIQSGIMPKWFNADPKPSAALFELTFPKINMVNISDDLKGEPNE